MARHIEVGYEGGSVVRLTVEPEAAEALLQALESGGWHRIAAHEGEHALNMDRAVYVRMEDRPDRIGFGGP